MRFAIGLYQMWTVDRPIIRLTMLNMCKGVKHCDTSGDTSVEVIELYYIPQIVA